LDVLGKLFEFLATYVAEKMVSILYSAEVWLPHATNSVFPDDGEATTTKNWNKSLAVPHDVKIQMTLVLT